MRDLIGIAVVVVLVFAALRMATALQGYRRGHEQRRERLDTEGRSVVAEVPAPDGLVFFAEDAGAFYWGERRIAKRDIKAVQVRFGDVPLSTARAQRFGGQAAAGPDPSGEVPDLPERAHWDVAIETADATVVVACGAIREHVSQELARRIFEKVSQAIAACDREERQEPAP